MASLLNTNSDHDGEPHLDHDSQSMGRFALPSTKDKPSVDIVLDAPYLTLKGTGPDVEPTRLSGNVVLHLTEATAIKEITLQFRGKARIPIPANESLINSTNSLTYVICHHNWSFLEGSVKHARTLKAGRHYFPFHLEVGGSLPSSISTPVLGGASIAYKLRALVVRPLLAHNLQCTISVPLLRSFTEEALEYQQTLEIENTWPDKIMYSVVLPHKAWAMGDKVGSLFKFCPLAKGTRVESVVTNIVETTKVFARSGNQESSRVVASSRHDLIEGRSVLIDVNQPWLIIGKTNLPRSPRVTPPSSRPSTSPSISQTPLSMTAAAPLDATSPSPSTSAAAASSPFIPPLPPSRSEVLPAESSSSSDSESSDDISSDLTIALFLPLPDGTAEIIPSHTLEPITVAHRIRWSIYIRNPDSHISELRCSLPIVILDRQLLNEARACSRMTRRAVLAPGLSNDANEDLGLGGDDSHVIDDAEDRQLPSYTAHVRDRVANMYLPEAVTMRVTNPWVQHGLSPVSPTGFVNSTTGGPDGEAPPVNSQETMNLVASALSGGLNGSGGHTPPTHISHPGTAANSSPNHTPAGQAPFVGHLSNPTSGYVTPLDVDSHVMSHLPHAPDSSVSTPLDWINSELMISLSEDPRTRFGGAEASHASRAGSRAGSRTHSRAGSPERGHPSQPLAPIEASFASSHAHHRGFGGFFKGAMKGFAFTKHHGPGSGTQSPTSHSHSSSSRPYAHGNDSCSSSSRLGPARSGSVPSNLSSLAFSPDPSAAPSFVSSSTPSRPSSPLPSQNHQSQSSALSTSHLPLASPSAVASTPAINSNSNDAMLHRAFTEVPDYSIASRGFIGGVPPLSSLQGLPSYEEAARDSRHRANGRPMAQLSQSGSSSRLGQTIRSRSRPRRTGIAAGEGVEDARKVASDGNLAAMFQSMGVVVPPSGRVESGPGGRSQCSGSGDVSEDDGIEMRTGRRRDVS